VLQQDTERLQSTLKSVRPLHNERHFAYCTARNRESVVRLVARLEDIGVRVSTRARDNILFNLNKLIPFYLSN
jgi:hypothetical protein